MCVHMCMLAHVVVLLGFQFNALYRIGKHSTT